LHITHIKECISFITSTHHVYWRYCPPILQFITAS